MIFPSTHKRGTHTSLDIIIAHTSTPSFFSIFLAKCQIKCFCWKCFYHYTIDPTRDLRQKMSELRRIFPCSRKANHVFHPRHDISQLAARICRKSIKPANRFAQDWIWSALECVVCFGSLMSNDVWVPCRGFGWKRRKEFFFKIR